MGEEMGAFKMSSPTQSHLQLEFWHSISKNQAFDLGPKVLCKGQFVYLRNYTVEYLPI